MAKVDYVRFLPITESEVAAQKVNYRQEKHLESELRSLEKAERYSKNIREKTNSILKQNMKNRIQRNALQACLKYSNSGKDGGTYVTLNRHAKQDSDNLHDAKLQHMMPRLATMCDMRSIFEENFNNSHRRLTRSSSDSCAIQLPSAPSLRKPATRSLSVDAGNICPPSRRRRSTSSAVTVHQGARIAWEPKSVTQQYSGLRSDDYLPRLVPPMAIPSTSGGKLCKQPPLDVMPKQHMQLRRSRSLPNTTLCSTSPSSKGKLSSLIEVSHRAESEECTRCEGNINDRKISRKESTVIPPNVSQLSISDDKRVPLRRVRARAAWYEGDDIAKPINFNGNASRPLRITKSLE